MGKPISVITIFKGKSKVTPAELAADHSFPGDYTFANTKREIIKQIGNSVPVSTARALCSRALAA